MACSAGALLLLPYLLTGTATALQQPQALTRRSFLAATGPALLVPQAAVAAYIDPSQSLPQVTQRVFLDVQIGDNDPPGRLTIGLFGELMPKATENFASLCGENKYAGTLFYRVLSDMTIQGGAIGDPIKGRTGQSAFGDPFEPDNFRIQHTKAGLVSAVRGVGGKIDSRFFIQTVDDGGWADDRYAVFGIVEEGMDYVSKIEKVDVQPPQNGPKKPVKIIKSGLVS